MDPARVTMELDLCAAPKCACEQECMVMVAYHNELVAYALRKGGHKLVPF